MSEIDVSFVMTVYNKERYLPSVLKALLNQTGLKNPEFIFCDDVSKDRSVEIIEEMTKGLPNVQIFKNKVNEGISVRINQGIMAAHGKYIRMLDSDDIFPLDSTEKMIELAQKYKADMVYGTFVKTGKEPEELTDAYLSPKFEVKYFKDAMRAIFKARFTRMGQLIKTEVLQKAQGADERVFIQDETIPLRCARLANGVVKMYENVVLVPKENGNLSGVKVQLDHDRYLAYYFFIKDHPELPKDVLCKLNMRAVSAYWKYTRKINPHAYLSKTLWYYLGAKTGLVKPNIKLLDRWAAEFLKASGVLRTKKLKK